MNSLERHMSEPYLILHKVRGAPAFDIAILCEDMGTDTDPGPWWIIPTSGHRAHPYWFEPMYSFINVNSEANQSLLNRAWSGEPNPGPLEALEHEVPSMPDDLPDHCQYSIDRKAMSDSSPIKSPELQSVLAALIKPQAPLQRRKL